MRKNRMTRAQLEREIEALIEKKKQLEEEAAQIFMKELMRKDIKNALADLSDEAIRQTAKNVANVLLREVTQIEKEANTAKMLYAAKKTDDVSQHCGCCAK